MDYGFLHLEVSTGGRRENEWTAVDSQQATGHPPTNERAQDKGEG
jgi:hypothetical protein